MYYNAITFFFAGLPYLQNVQRRSNCAVYML